MDKALATPSPAAATTRKPICVDRDTTVVDATKVMRRYRVQELIVAERANGAWAAAGIVFAWDIVTRVIAAGLDPGVVTTGDIAWTDPRSSRENENVTTRLGILRAAGHDILTILDRRGALWTVVTLDELLRTSPGRE